MVLKKPWLLAPRLSSLPLRINCLQNSVGDWLDLEQQIIDHILGGYKELYKTQHASSVDKSDFEVDWATSLSKEESRLLSANVTPIEIHNALLSLKPYKAPRPDGLHAGFFQHFWPSLGNSVTEEVLRIFAIQKMPTYLNQTLVVLIPKKNWTRITRAL